MKTRILFLVLALTLLSVQVLAQQPDQPQNPPQEGNFIERFFTKEVHQHAEEFYKYVETFFLDYFLPGYYHVKKSMLLTSAAIMILSLFFIRFLASLFGGSGRSGVSISIFEDCSLTMFYRKSSDTTRKSQFLTRILTRY